jgi:FkbM family methyltransferase
MKSYYEVRPGIDAVRYLLTYSFLTLLAKRAKARPQRMFVEIASNIDRHILSEGLFEKGVIDLLLETCSKVRRTSLMIDIGANIGNHTVALARTFKRVEAVEPHPVLFRVLEANVIHNQLAHVTCHNIGLAGEDAKGTLVASVDNHGLNRVEERSQLPPEVFGLSKKEFGTRYAIELKSAIAFVSTFADSLDEAFIKIDVEGMEEEIIASIAPLLHQHKPLLGFEWFTSSHPNMVKLVTSFPGYELWGIRIHDKGKSLLWRAIKIMFQGRSYTLERIDTAALDDVYPLALLVPSGALD